MKRKYSFESIRARIKQAETEDELEMVSDLVDELAQCDLITSSKYCELEYLLDDRLSTLILEGKI